MPVIHESDTCARGRSPITLAYSLRCHPGAVRSENQDRVLHTQTLLGELFLVADGVGGHAFGAEAAEIAVREYARVLGTKQKEMDVQVALQEATTFVSESIAAAAAKHRIDLAPGTNDGKPAAMASTVVLALLDGETATLGHLGDSRAYVFRDHKLLPLTQDHSVVQRMVKAGILASDQAPGHPSAHILTHCLGQDNASLELQTLLLREKDILLLCSDGLWACLPPNEIESILEESATGVDATADVLLAVSLAAGAPDNVSIILVRIQAASPEEILPPSRPRRARGYFLMIAVLVVAVLAAVLAFRTR